MFPPAHIKNIIFDLGGVVLNIDYLLSTTAFKNLGVNNFDKLYSQAQQSNLFDRLEKGNLSPQNFRDELRQLCGLPITDKQIDQAWNAMLLDLPVERLMLLTKLKSRYRTFLLSNTNEIHYWAYINNLEEQHGVDTLAGFFEKEYLSFNIHLRKPDKEIFEYVLNDAGLNPAETLFIDDTLRHVEGAKAVGIEAILLENGTTINQLFTGAT
jgi:putative hydrolase of the HAD superfamily